MEQQDLQHGLLPSSTLVHWQAETPLAYGNSQTVPIRFLKNERCPGLHVLGAILAISQYRHFNPTPRFVQRLIYQLASLPQNVYFSTSVFSQAVPTDDWIGFMLIPSKHVFMCWTALATDKTLEVLAIYSSLSFVKKHSQVEESNPDWHTIIEKSYTWVWSNF